ncbi:hypothetical protein J155_03645 [Xanthomonas citri pv. citri]|nr:Hypothetical Protein XCAW_04175 [Xanthomonas citri subsp. citri Aw12879]AJD70072.1 hypothetical protein J151_03666 [Xanthomonas citri subsp. citri A306]AJY83583.1 hypothetical protein J159_03640 [Xanthomonas citri pv. citri]AJY88008.1 hypothetical protein J158_03643 [Xanthomonas citri subsp. citri UI6]UIE41430.1 hypothetical protein FICKIIDM_00526 [Xanthomonas citri pv. punicae]
MLDRRASRGRTGWLRDALRVLQTAIRSNPCRTRDQPSPSGSSALTNTAAWVRL